VWSGLPHVLQLIYDGLASPQLRVPCASRCCQLSPLLQLMSMPQPSPEPLASLWSPERAAPSDYAFDLRFLDLLLVGCLLLFRCIS